MGREKERMGLGAGPLEGRKKIITSPFKRCPCRATAAWAVIVEKRIAYLGWYEINCRYASSLHICKNVE